jgi:multidrug efflux pump subunit AcrB
VFTGKAKGAYVPGYGVTFSFTVNIFRGALATPFGTVQTQDLTPAQKLRRIEDVKEKMSRVLLENGPSLRQVRLEDWITIEGFFDDRDFVGESNQSRTVILSIRKKDLDEACRAEDRWKEFKQRMKTVEY